MNTALEAIARRKTEINVIVYTRHSKGCGHAENRDYLGCKCPKWLEWRDEKRQHKVSAKTRDREVALGKARDVANSFARLAKGEVEPPKTNGTKSLADAITLFVDTMKGETSEKHWKYKIKNELAEFQTFAHAKGVMDVADVTTEHCLQYRNALDGEPNTRKQKVERLVRFFQFVFESGWILRNPAAVRRMRIKGERKQSPKSLTDAQFQQLLAAIPKMNAQTTDADRQRLRSLLLLMRWTGLSLRDAVCIEKQRFHKLQDGWYRVQTARAKTGKPVFCIIRNDIAVEILRTPDTGSKWRFVKTVPADERALDNLTQSWGYKFSRLGQVAALKDEHNEPLNFTSHWMRHTFVHHCLQAGMPTEDVAALIGDTVKVVADFYSEWITARQDRLEERMRRMLLSN